MMAMDITIKNSWRALGLASLLIVLSVFGFQGRAQHLPDELHFNLDWQVNAPIGTDFANHLSGWGMSFEFGYEVAGPWSLGAFASFHTNHQYVERQTIHLSPTEALTTDQQHSAFQVPFGALVSYSLYDNGYVQPYVTAKLGAMYQQNTTYLNTVGYYERPWGFYVSPEIGVNIHPLKYSRFGFHVAAYYSYGTNETDLLNYAESGRSNLGFRLGICF